MVDFQSIFCHVLVSGAAEWPFESDGCAAGLQNFFQAYRAVLHNLLFDSFEENKYYSICRCWRCTRARWQQVAGAAPCHSLTALAAAPGASSIPRCVFAVCVCVCCLCVCVRLLFVCVCVSECANAFVSVLRVFLMLLSQITIPINAFMHLLCIAS